MGQGWEMTTFAARASRSLLLAELLVNQGMGAVGLRLQSATPSGEEREQRAASSQTICSEKRGSAGIQSVRPTDEKDALLI
jgi:hypothetical protein